MAAIKAGNRLRRGFRGAIGTATLGIAGRESSAARINCPKASQASRRERFGIARLRSRRTAGRGIRRGEGFQHVLQALGLS